MFDHWTLTKRLTLTCPGFRKPVLCRGFGRERTRCRAPQRGSGQERHAPHLMSAIGRTGTCPNPERNQS